MGKTWEMGFSESEICTLSQNNVTSITGSLPSFWYHLPVEICGLVSIHLVSNAANLTPFRWGGSVSQSMRTRTKTGHAVREKRKSPDLTKDREHNTAGFV